MNKVEEIRKELRRIRRENLTGVNAYKQPSHILSYSIDNDTDPAYMYIHSSTVEEMFEYLRDRAEYVNIIELGKTVIRYRKEGY